MNGARYIDAAAGLIAAGAAIGGGVARTGQALAWSGRGVAAGWDFVYQPRRSHDRIDEDTDGQDC